MNVINKYPKTLMKEVTVHTINNKLLLINRHNDPVTSIKILLALEEAGMLTEYCNIREQIEGTYINLFKYYKSEKSLINSVISFREYYCESKFRFREKVREVFLEAFLSIKLVTEDISPLSVFEILNSDEKLSELNAAAIKNKLVATKLKILYESEAKIHILNILTDILSSTFGSLYPGTREFDITSLRNTAKPVFVLSLKECEVRIEELIVYNIKLAMALNKEGHSYNNKSKIERIIKLVSEINYPSYDVGEESIASSLEIMMT